MFGAKWTEIQGASDAVNLEFVRNVVGKSRITNGAVIYGMTRQCERHFRHAQVIQEMVYGTSMSRTNIDLDEGMIRKARKLTRLKTKRQIVDKALKLLVRSESRKGVLRYYGSGVWKGDLRASRRNRV